MRAKHIRLNLKISPVGLFTIQIEAGCVNRRLRLKMDCKNLSSLQPMHTHTLSSLHGSPSAASASSPIIPRRQRRPPDRIPAADGCFQPPVIVVPRLCRYLPGQQFFAGVGVVAACLCWPVDCASPSVVLSQGIDEQMACHISPCKAQVLQSAASCRTCFTAD